MAKPLEDWTPDELRIELGAARRRARDPATAPSAAAAPAKGRIDVVRACENWVRGLAWDETFTQEMVEDELAIHERKAGSELGRSSASGCVQLWLGEYDRRYRAA